MCCHLRRTETLRSGLTVLQMTVSESNLFRVELFGSVVVSERGLSGGGGQGWMGVPHRVED
jgi:hypothetical protein